MLDSIIVLAIVAIAAYFVGRKLYRQFTAKSPECNCAGCDKSATCGQIQDKPQHNCCSR